MKFNKSMVEYVLDKQRFSETDAIAVFNITNYANFLSQKLELWMFIACDENRNVLEEPIKSDFEAIPFDFEGKNYHYLLEEYQTALSKVIFEGFVYYGEESNVICAKSDLLLVIFDNNKNDVSIYNFELVKEIKSIEDLLKYNLDIKESIAKELGLI